MLGTIAFFSGSPASDAIASTRSVNVIFDTDVCRDIDDAMALAIVHAMQDRHEANLVAVTVGLNERSCAPFISALNVFYGHPNIPVGTLKTGLDMKAAREKGSKAIGRHLQGTDALAFAEFILEQRHSDGSEVYPRRLTDDSQAPEAVSLLRETLAKQPDQSVVMIQVGYGTNFAALLDSGSDAISKLNGSDLIKKKIRLLSVMAGEFNTKAINTGTNIYEDVPSAQKVFNEWPTPVVVSGAEVGGSISFPALSIERDFSYASRHPIAEGYRFYCATFLRQNFPDWVKQCPHDHHTADLTAAFYALRPDRNYFSLSKPGKITVLPSGNIRFVEEKSGNHRYLMVSKEQKIRAQEAMVMLVSQPPSGLKQ